MRHGLCDFISQGMTKVASKYARKNPVIIGLFGVFFIVVIGMIVAGVAGFATPSDVFAQLATPVVPPTPTPTPIVPPTPTPTPIVPPTPTPTPVVPPPPTPTPIVPPTPTPTPIVPPPPAPTPIVPPPPAPTPVVPPAPAPVPPAPVVPPVTPVPPPPVVPVAVSGCTDSSATNFNPDATVDDGSCTYPSAQIPGCTDPKATNYNPDATVDDGSCTYGGGGGGGGGPTCTMTVSPASTRAGNSATLTWGGSGILNVDIDNGIATATSSPGSTTVAPTAVGSYTYTGTFHATNGQTLTCSATLNIEGGSGGGGGGGGGGAGGGGAGGGGGPVPTITLSVPPHVATQQLAYLYLSQIPYTGLDLGPVGTVVYWLVLIVLSLVATYFVLFGAAPYAYRRVQMFGVRVAEAVNAPQPAPVAPAFIAPPEPPRPDLPLEEEQEVPEAPRSYSSYEGFKSFAHEGGALSVEDIVKGLSHVRPTVPAPSAKMEEAVEPAAPKETPVQPAPEQEPAVADASVRGFVASLLDGDRPGVFAGLRQYVRGGGSPEQLLDEAARLVDEAYRARIDGTPADESVARLAARFPTPVLERIVASLVIAIDSSYADGITGAKLALSRALSVVRGEVLT